MLEINNICFSYDNQIVINDFSLKASSKDRIAVLGPSGSGKSTMLRVLVGLEKPTSGNILWNGVDITNTKPENRGFGLLFQNYTLFPHMSVKNNILYGAKNKNSIEYYLELIDLKGYGNKFPHELSGGQKQRVALARVLASEPKLLLLDEPFSNFDTALKQKIRLEVAAILDSLKIPLIIVTHDFEDAKILANSNVMFECFN